MCHRSRVLNYFFMFYIEIVMILNSFNWKRYTIDDVVDDLNLQYFILKTP